jgi:hypothetical protein
MKKLIVFLTIFVSFESLFCYEEPIFNINDRDVGGGYMVKDFYVYNYSESYLQGYARLYYSGSNYRQYVSMTISFFNNGLIVGSKETFADYETYGSYGMLPGTETYLSYYIDKVDFDSVFFNVSYNSSDGTKARFNKDAIAVTNTLISSFSGSTKKIAGIVKNLSEVALKYPSVFMCLYIGGKMVQYKMTFADAPDNSLESYQTATFYTYMDLPTSYDSIKYVPNYSPSLTGPVIISYVVHDINNIVLNNYFLFANYPNPFNMTTMIEFFLPIEGNAKLKIIDMQGREVAILMDGFQTAGYHASRWNASGLSSGTYYYCLEAGSFKSAKRALLLK